jgi:hypothetical protein
MTTGANLRNEHEGYGRDQAWQLLTEWTLSENLRKHALAVEACVVACGEAEADRLGLIGPGHAQERTALVELYSTTSTTSATPRPTSIPSLESANWNGWAGPSSCEPPSWATPNTPACRASRIWISLCLAATSWPAF